LSCANEFVVNITRDRTKNILTNFFILLFLQINPTTNLMILHK